MKRKAKVTVLALAMTTLMASVAFATSDEAPALREKLMNRFGGFKGQHMMLEGSGLTQEQITEITEGIKDGKGLEEIAQEMGIDLESFKDRSSKFMGAHMGIIKDSSLLQSLLEETGLTKEELAAELKEGKTLEDIAEEMNIDLEVIKQELLEARLAELDERVSEGKITEEEAAELKERIEGCFENSEGGYRGMMGGMRGRRVPNKIKLSTTEEL